MSVEFGHALFVLPVLPRGLTSHRTILFSPLRLQMLIINRTPNTLTNLTVELSTMGDLRLVERPQSHTIGPLDTRNIRANIKVGPGPAWTCFCLGPVRLEANTLVPSAMMAPPWQATAVLETIDRPSIVVELRGIPCSPRDRRSPLIPLKLRLLPSFGF